MTRIKDDAISQPPPPKPVQPAAPKVAPQAQPPKKVFGADEMSTGQGGALRRAAATQLNSQGLSTTNAPAPVTGATFKASMLGSVTSARFIDGLTPTPVPTGTVTNVASPVDPVKQAQDDVATLYKEKPYLESSDVAGLIAAHPNDPVYAANVVKQVNDQSDGVLMATFNGNGATPEEQKVIAAAISDGITQGTLPPDFVDQVKTLPGGAGQAMETAIGQVKGNEASAIATAAQSPKLQTDTVASLTQLADQKKQGIAEAEGELGRLMSKLGPLTDDQKKAFIAQFKADHQDVFDAYATAQSNLSSYVGANQASLTAAAKSDPDAAKTLAAAYKNLVGTPEEAELGLGDPSARTMVANGLTDKGIVSALAAADPDFANVTAPAAADALLQQVGTSQDHEGAFQKLKELVDAYGQSGVPGLADSAKTIADSMPALESAFKTLVGAPISRASLGEFEKSWQEISKKAGETTPLGKVFAGAGFALGVLEVGEGALSGNRDEVLKGLGDGITNSAAIGYGAQMLGGWLSNEALQAAGEGAADVLEKVGGAAGALIGAINVLQDTGHLDKGSDKAKLVGDALTTLGGALLLVPGLEEFGVVASIAGGLTNFGAGLLAGKEQSDLDKTYDDEANKILAGLSDPKKPDYVDPNLAKMLMGLDPSVTSQLTKTLGLSSADWVKLADNDKDAVQTLSQLADRDQDALRTLAASGLTGTRLVDLLQANPSALVLLDSNGASGVATLQKVFNLSPDQLAQALSRMAAAGGDSDALREVLNDINLEGGVNNPNAMLAYFKKEAASSDFGPQYAAVAQALLNH